MEGGREGAGKATDITRLLGGRFLPSPRTSIIAGEGGEAASDEDILEASLKSEITDSKHKIACATALSVSREVDGMDVHQREWLEAAQHQAQKRGLTLLTDRHKETLCSLPMVEEQVLCEINLEIDKKTSVDWRSYCSEAGKFWFDDQQDSIGSDGVIVEVDKILSEKGT